ncbi:hypothetical protein Tco_0243404 [Tanacetum coccineum]
MDLETTKTNATAKLPILKQDEFTKLSTAGERKKGRKKEREKKRLDEERIERQKTRRRDARRKREMRKKAEERKKEERIENEDRKKADRERKRKERAEEREERERRQERREEVRREKQKKEDKKKRSHEKEMIRERNDERRKEKEKRRRSHREEKTRKKKEKKRRNRHEEERKEKKQEEGDRIRRMTGKNGKVHKLLHSNDLEQESTSESELEELPEDQTKAFQWEFPLSQFSIYSLSPPVKSNSLTIYIQLPAVSDEFLALIDISMPFPIINAISSRMVLSKAKSLPFRWKTSQQFKVCPLVRSYSPGLRIGSLAVRVVEVVPASILLLRK